MFSIRKIPRSKPLAGEFVLGLALAAWGLYILAFPCTNLLAIKNWHWLSATGETVPVALLTAFVGSIQLVSMWKCWYISTKISAAFAAAFWFEFAQKTFTTTPIHPPASIVYLILAFCNVLIVYAEKRE
jgi:hypothetical protein